MAKQCPDCSAIEGDKAFYATSPYCMECHNKRMVNDRKQAHRRPKVNAYNNQWLKQHRKANSEAQRRWRERHAMELQPLAIPPDRMTVREAMGRLSLHSRFRVTQLIDQGRLRAIKERGQWLIERADVEGLAKQREESAEG